MNDTADTDPHGFRARWRADATGPVARYAGQFADAGLTTDLDELTTVVRAMPNGSQIEIVTVPL